MSKDSEDAPHQIKWAWWFWALWFVFVLFVIGFICGRG